MSIKRTYQRSPVLNFFDLTEEQQAQAKDQCDKRAEEGSYVLWNYPDGRTDVLPLEMFMKISYPDVKLFQAIYGTSYFSAWMIRVNKTGEEATVVNCYW